MSKRLHDREESVCAGDAPERAAALPPEDGTLRLCAPRANRAKWRRTFSFLSPFTMDALSGAKVTVCPVSFSLLTSTTGFVTFMISKSAPAPEKKSVEPILKKTEAVTPPPKPTGGIIERPVVTSVDVKV